MVDFEPRGSWRSQIAARADAFFARATLTNEVVPQARFSLIWAPFETIQDVTRLFCATLQDYVKKQSMFCGGVNFKERYVMHGIISHKNNQGFNIAPWDVHPVWHFGIMQGLLLGLITGLNGQQGLQFGICEPPKVRNRFY